MTTPRRRPVGGAARKPATLAEKRAGNTLKGLQTCRICNNTEPELRKKLEFQGALCLKGAQTWRGAIREAGDESYSGQQLKNHMTKHVKVVQDVGDIAKNESTLKQRIQFTIQGLLAKMVTAPVELQPLYAVAVHNLMRIEETQPSQANLIKALDTIQQITGMKMQQAMLLQFATAAFQEAAIEVIEVPEPKAEIETSWESKGWAVPLQGEEIKGALSSASLRADEH